MSKKMLIIGGSVRQEESKSNFIVDVIEERALDLGVKPVIWKLGYKPLPLAQHAWHKNPSLSNDGNVEGLAVAIAEAEVVCLVSPIYNGSYTGVLKNALDCMLGDALEGKQVVLVGVGSGSTALLPCVHLQDVARTMGGEVYHRFAVVTSNDLDFEQKTVDEAMTRRFSEIIDAVTT
ncbi:MAG: NADPH-dependent FMN reductase [Candidatus Saccharimonadales bacterium]